LFINDKLLLRPHLFDPQYFPSYLTGNRIFTYLIECAPQHMLYIRERYEASAGKTRLINHLHGFNLSPCRIRPKKKKEFPLKKQHESALIKI